MPISTSCGQTLRIVSAIHAEGRAFTAANQNFAEEIRNRQPGVKKVLDQPIG